MLVLRRMNSMRRRRENNTRTQKKTMKSQQSTKYSLEKLEICNSNDKLLVCRHFYVECVRRR